MLEEWTDGNVMNFDKNKCKALHRAKKNQPQPAVMGTGCLGSNSVEKAMGALADSKVSMSLQ